MRIAIQNPHWLHLTDSLKIHDYGVEFIRLFKPLIYLSRADYRPQLARFLAAKGLDVDEFEVIYTVPTLNRRADILMCLNGFPHIPPHEPVRLFAGLKIYHVMDYMIDTALVRDALVNGAVDYVMGYAAHDRYDPFFRSIFRMFAGRVIGVPFGFHPRFAVTAPFGARRNKCVAVGAVHPLCDPSIAKSRQRELAAFYSHEPWLHKFAHLLTEPAVGLQDIVDAAAPVRPEAKSTGADWDAALNAYRLFVPAESLLHFAPASAFAGPATGAVMVCSDHACFRDLGFIDGVNCIMHRECDLADFRRKVESCIASPECLYTIHAEGTRFVRERYSHEAVAQALYADIDAIWTARSHQPDTEIVPSDHISALTTAGYRLSPP